MPKQHKGETLKDVLMNLRVITPSGCWELNKKKDKHYTYLGFQGVRYTAHVASAIVFLGHDRYSDLDICHHCDNGHCWNPDHIFIGTTSENILDSVSKKRWIHRGFIRKPKCQSNTTFISIKETD